MSALETELADDLNKAFPTFVRMHQHAVYSTALSLAKNHHDAQDIAQETFVRAYRSLERWERQRIIDLQSRAWLARIAVNLCRNAFRDKGRRVTTVALDAHTAPDEDAGPELQLEIRSDLETWRHRLSALAPAEASAIVLKHVWGLSYPEIAESAGVAEGTVKARVHRGLGKLRTALEEVSA